MRNQMFVLRFEAMNFGGKDKFFEVEAPSASNVNVALFASQCDLVHVNTAMWSIVAKSRPGKVLSASRAWIIRNDR